MLSAEVHPQTEGVTLESFTVTKLDSSTVNKDAGWGCLDPMVELSVGTELQFSQAVPKPEAFGPIVSNLVEVEFPWWYEKMPEKGQE